MLFDKWTILTVDNCYKWYFYLLWSALRLKDIRCKAIEECEISLM